MDFGGGSQDVNSANFHLMSNTSSNNQNQTNIFEQYEQAKKESGRFLKLTPGERRALQFNVNAITIRDSEFEGKLTGGKSVDFAVIDPALPQVQKIFTVSVKKADAIMALLKADKTLLDIQKIGSGKDSTYVVIPL
jgi:hypothetical protein